MVLEFLDLIFSFINSFLDILPSLDFNFINLDAVNEFFKYISYMLYFYPSDLFIAQMTCVIFWIGAQFAWAPIEFVIKIFMLS